jgi:hypothetical protein
MGKKGMIIFCCILMITLSIVPGSAARSDTYTFIVITPAQFMEELTSLVSHKESHGITTRIVTLEDISIGTYFPATGRDAAEQIKYFIKNAKETWGTAYVLLVGGKDIMPVRFTRTCFFDENFSELYVYYPSDLYYADLYFSNGSFCSWDSNNDGLFADKNKTGCLDDVDLAPDVYVGRILSNTESEVITVVDKIINYENNTAGQAWFNNLIVCGADDARSMVLETILPFLLGRIGFPVFEGEFLGNTAAKILPGFSAKKIYGSGLLRPSVKGLTITNINNAINEGAGFLMFNGHGSPDYAISTNFPFMKRIWLPLPHQYFSSDVDVLTNGYKLPVALFGGCNCGDFNASQSPIAWKFVAHENGGAIASFACTAGAVMILGSLCKETLHGHMLMRIFASYAEGTDRVGALWSDSITNYLNDQDALDLGDAFSMQNWRHTLSNHYVLEQWTLFGDPTLKIGGYP